VRKVLVANRGSIALRAVRTCGDLDADAVAVFTPPDAGALHVRFASEAYPVASYADGPALVALARRSGCDAVYPGYGFLAEDAEFAGLCEREGLIFVGPDSEALRRAGDRMATLAEVERAGFDTVRHSTRAFDPSELPVMEQVAAALGYPVVVKSLRGGRGRGSRLAMRPGMLGSAVEAAAGEAQIVYGSTPLYLEQAVLEGHQLGVQIVADREGMMTTLGEHEGSVQRGNQKLVDESPAPSLSAERRKELLERSLAIARLLRLSGVFTVEFLADADGHLLFTEVKPRLTREHPVIELCSRADLVAVQLRLAAGQRMAETPAEVPRRGVAIQARLIAEDPARGYLPAPGRVERLRLPGGPHVLVETHLVDGYDIPVVYDPALAGIAAWGEDRDEAVRRLRRALEEFTLIGPPTNLPVLLRLVRDPAFGRGDYSLSLFNAALSPTPPADEDEEALAIAAALAYVRRHLSFRQVVPDRLRGGWHRESRRIP